MLCGDDLWLCMCGCICVVLIIIIIRPRCSPFYIIIIIIIIIIIKGSKSRGGDITPNIFFSPQRSNPTLHPRVYEREKNVWCNKKISKKNKTKQWDTFFQWQLLKMLNQIGLKTRLVFMFIIFPTMFLSV